MWSTSANEICLEVMSGSLEPACRSAYRFSLCYNNQQCTPVWVLAEKQCRVEQPPTFDAHVAWVRKDVSHWDFRVRDDSNKSSDNSHRWQKSGNRHCHAIPSNSTFMWKYQVDSGNTALECRREVKAGEEIFKPVALYGVASTSSGGSEGQCTISLLANGLSTQEVPKPSGLGYMRCR